MSTRNQETFERKKNYAQIGATICSQKNAAEAAIKIFKDNFISGLFSVDPTFPIHLWCRLISLVTTNLNLLRPSSINTCISDQEILNDCFEYNRTPLATLGARVIVYEMLSKRVTWEPHRKDGWYLDYAPYHYRFHKTYIKEKSSERISHTVEFSHTTFHSQKYHLKIKFARGCRFDKGFKQQTSRLNI